ncbi:MAG TPA: GcrA family cell cycle regulator [Candidatus Paceibacterota bacterium]|nr:GcrA family cell cycle regulator [Candidatus Paceibacterota bacterium]
MGSNQKSGWTEDRVDLLKQLWNGGLSASAIAERLGGVTNNAVMGKVHRLELPAHDKPASAGSRSDGTGLSGGNHQGLVAHRMRERKKAAARAASRAAPGPVAQGDMPLLPSLSLSLMQIEDGMCKMLTGENLYCGNPTGSKREPYCAGHKHRLSQKVQPKLPTYQAF